MFLIRLTITVMFAVLNAFLVCDPTPTILADTDADQFRLLCLHPLHGDDTEKEVAI